MAFANAALLELSREPQRRIANKTKKILNDGKHRMVGKANDRSKLREKRGLINSWYLGLWGSPGNHGRAPKGTASGKLMVLSRESGERHHLGV